MYIIRLDFTVLSVVLCVDSCIASCISTYKFKRAFFRHDRRTAPKFGTHVRIETRLALTNNFFTENTPEGFRGLFIDVCGMWHVCGWFVA